MTVCGQWRGAAWALLGVLAWAAPSVRAEYVWIEGEAPAKSNFVKHNWYDNVKKERLSGQEWLSHYGPNPGEASYTFRIKQAGKFTLWVRCNNLLVTMHFKLNGGEWRPCDFKDKHGEFQISEKIDHRDMAWHRFGRFELPAGENTLAFRLTSKIKNHGGIDCFVFSSDPQYVPSGVQRPGNAAPAAAGGAAEAPASSSSIPVQENFEAMQLERLRGGIEVTGKSKESVIEIVSKKGRGKVLHCVARKDGLAPGLHWKLNPKAFAGKPIRCTFKALFPGTYEPNAEKSWERPRVQLAAKKADGKMWYWGPPYPKPKTAEWQTLSGKSTVPGGIKSMDLYVRVDRRKAEIWFDDMVLEIQPGAGPPPEPQPTAGSKPRPLTAAEWAKKAPSRSLAGGGLYFNTTVAVSLQAGLKQGLKGARARKVLFVGPGLAAQGPKLPEASPGWTFQAGPKALRGKGLSALGLLQALPDTLAQERPAFVFVRPPAKLQADDPMLKADWSDLCRQCLLFGAVPVLVIPETAKKDDPARTALMGLVQEAKFPALDAAGGAALYARRAQDFLRLLNKYVFGKGKGGKGSAKTPGANEEEEEE